MTPAETISFVGGFVGIIGGIYVICEKIWGGGNRLAKAFADSEKETKKQLDAQAAIHAADISSIRADFVLRIDEYNKNAKQGFDAIGSNIHALQLGFAEFRSQMAENYMRRDSFYKTADEMKADFKSIVAELKSDIRSEFTEVKADLDGLAKSVEAARRERA